MTGSLRSRVVALLAAVGLLAGVAGYLFGAPVSYSVLVPAMALVAVLVLTVGVRAGAFAAVLAAAAFLYVQLAAVERPLAIDFGSGSPTLDLPTVLRGAAATWLPTLLGVVALLIVLAVASLLRDGLDAAAPVAERVHEPAEEPDGEAEASRRWATGAAFVRVSLGANTKEQPFRKLWGKRLTDIVDETLGPLRQNTVVWGEDDSKIRMIVWGADEDRANALVRRVEEAAKRQFNLPLDSVVLALQGPELFAQPTMAAAPEPAEPAATVAEPTEPAASAVMPRPTVRRPRAGATEKEPKAAAKEPKPTAARPARPKATAPRPAQPVPAPARGQPGPTATKPKAAAAQPAQPATTTPVPATEAESIKAEVALRGRPDGARTSSRNARRGS